MTRLANFDKVALGEMSVDLLGQKTLIAKFKLVNSENGRSYGSTSKREWSPEVWAKFAELRELLEREVDAGLFEGGAETTPTQTGIGELFGEDPDSV
jgi:hypothetical protein